MKREKLEILVLVLAAAALGGGLVFVLMKYILPVILPFAAAFIAAAAVRAPAAALSRKTHISERVLRPMLALLATAGALLLLALLIMSLGSFLAEWLIGLSDESGLYSALTKLSAPSYLSDRIPEEAAAGFLECIKSALTSLLESMTALFAKFAFSLPDILISLLITVISVIYFSVDIDRICSFLKSFFPEKYKSKISDYGRKFLDILGKYVKSYLQIMAITFLIMLAGLLILGVGSPAETAFIIAVLDLLPLLGVGVVLLPWSILSFAMGDGALGVGLIVLFLVYTVIREALEPKIFGRSLNVHPIVTLVSLYIGYSLFGIFGLVIFPIAAVFLVRSSKEDESSEVG